MAYENKDLTVKIKEVDQAGSAVLIENDKGEGWFKVAAPAKVQFARTGDATVKFKENDIVYLRMVSSGPVKPRSTGWPPPKTQNDGFNPMNPPVEKVGGNSAPTPFKQAQGYPNKFKKNDFDDNPYHMEVIEEGFEGLTLQETIDLVKVMKDEGKFVFATNRFATGKHVEDKKKKMHMLYDLITFTKVKKDGKRE